MNAEEKCEQERVKRFVFSNKFDEQSKWILKRDKENKLEILDCPKTAGCKYCVVSEFINKYLDSSGCSVEKKILASKNYLRRKKLKRLINEKQ